jgi:hypothetical protein
LCHGIKVLFHELSHKPEWRAFQLGIVPVKPIVPL